MYQYQVGFGEAVRRAFSAYCRFSGRASRSEYWWFALFNAVVGFAFYILMVAMALIFGLHSEAVENGIMTAFIVVSYAYSLATLLPSLGLCVRRLHDIGKGGGWIFLGLVPIVGAIILIVWYCQDSQRGDNRFGPEPNMTDGVNRF